MYVFAGFCKLMLSVQNFISILIRKSIFFHICAHVLSLISTPGVYQTIHNLGKSAHVLISSWCKSA